METAHSILEQGLSKSMVVVVVFVLLEALSVLLVEPRGSRIDILDLKED
jgi:hypothetical protein